MAVHSLVTSVSEANHQALFGLSKLKVKLKLWRLEPKIWRTANSSVTLTVLRAFKEASVLTVLSHKRNGLESRAVVKCLIDLQQVR